MAIIARGKPCGSTTFIFSLNYLQSRVGINENKQKKKENNMVSIKG
ncbi:hypothetical protein [Clostridium sp. HBUAS56017]|nr:hypothetical protein [Clostridium sp. HBUAS56017]